MSQLKRTPSGYTYTENSSKNRAGGFGQLRVENKAVPICENPSAGERCHCYLLDLYLSKIPNEAKEKDVFYVRPLAHVKNPSLPWYTSVPVGRNSLNQMVPKMCSEAQISGRKTNHSLRATGATELYNAGVPEKIIKEQTGHRSTDGLRVYERTSQNQHQAVSKILSSKQPTSYVQEMESVRANSSASPSPCTLPVPPGSNSLPQMTFNNCRVNININPVSTQTNEQIQQNYLGDLSLDDITSFINDCGN